MNKEKMLNEMAHLAGVPMTEGYEESDISALLEAEGSEGAIKALRDTDYKDGDAHFKMVQLLKGVAVASKDGDEKAKKFMDAVSDALTTAAKKVLGEDVIGEAKKKGGSVDQKAAQQFLKKFQKLRSGLEDLGSGFSRVSTIKDLKSAISGEFASNDESLQGTEELLQDLADGESPWQ